ncbi:MAG TPA: protein translocase subunit SecF [Bryobacteraceae bacterium]|nr:protein translocase subunit SecF [Bryobacteraceae bacterium]
MELFKDTRFDFLGRQRLFIAASLLLTVAGLASLILKGGPRYGVEFRGGAVMDVQWAGTPPIAEIRAAISPRVPGVSVVEAHDLTGSNELLISTQIEETENLTAIREAIISGLAEVHGSYKLGSFEAIGPQIGADLRHQALLATASASAGMLAYLAWRFRWIYGAAAVIAVVHDTFLTVGLFSLAGKEISLTVVAALLTLIGYSMNDTIVVFDRIRDNRKRMPREPLRAVVNLSINQTLSRTALSSGLTLLTALALLAFGGPVLNGFSLALVAGIIVGTYSSIFVASPILVAWDRWSGGVR